jgi:iron complex outermembrane receptor protein
LRAFINGQNLFVITDYTGIDPEVRYSYGGNVLAPGVDARDTWVFAVRSPWALTLNFDRNLFINQKILI